MSKIAYINSSSSGVDYHRLSNPLSYLADDHEITAYNSIPLDKVDDVEADVLIYSRCMYEPEQMDIIQKFKARGTRVIVDIDDYWGLPQKHPAYLDYKQHGIPKKIVQSIKWADMVWTTHSKLAREIDKLGQKRVRVYPNALDPTDEQWVPKHLESDRFRIGFVGGVTHEHDLYETATGWKVAHAENDYLQGVLCGVNDDALEMYQRYHYIMSGGGGGDVRAIAQMDVHNYGLMYDRMDVSIAPLYNSDDAPGIYKTDNWRKAFAKILRKSKRQLQDEGEQLREYVLENYDIRNHQREI